MASAIVGGQWGDEGKGKLVDALSGKFDVIVRATGGANAGHTIYMGAKKFVFHLVPAGMFNKRAVCVMSNGMVVHLPTLLEEIDVLKKFRVEVGGRLLLSDRAHLVFEYHKLVDRLQEELKGGKKIGTTGRGIGPAYADKTSRIGIRAGELKNFAGFSAHFRANVFHLKKMYGFKYDAERELKSIKKILPKVLPLISDTSALISSAIRAKKRVLLEGANGVLLDIDHGTYPFVTSSNASIGGIIAGSGVPPNALTQVIGIMKAYCTRVGSGPFPTELKDRTGAALRAIGAEFGATTGRPRRCGWFDAVAARYSVQLNGFTAINLTKLDVMTGLEYVKIGVSYNYKGEMLKNFPADAAVQKKCVVKYVVMRGWKQDISHCRRFSDLPATARAYVKKLEQLIGCPIRWIGTGVGREDMIER